MWRTLTHWLLGPLASVWLLSRIRHDGEMTYPRDPPLSHGSGPDPDRVLLIGGAVVGGAGVASYDLALGGRLARKLAARTGRGADVETRSTLRYTTETAAALLRDGSLDRFDAVVIILGVREIMRMRPTAMWRRDVHALLDAIREIAPPSLPILLVGVAAFGRDMDVPRFVERWLDETVAKHNDETRIACELTGVAEYVPFEPTRNGIRWGRDASLVYESWATALVPAVDRVLAAAQPQPRIGDSDEGARQQAVADLGLLAAAPNPRLDQIVQMARGMLGLHAALTVVDEDRLHVVATTWRPAAGPLPRRDTFTHLAIESPGVLVVPDADAVPEYRALRRARPDDPVRFFAGYPLEAPGGQRIGTLCVYDADAREFSADDVSLLRDLALRAQTLLWEAGAQ